MHSFNMLKQHKRYIAYTKWVFDGIYKEILKSITGDAKQKYSGTQTSLLLFKCLWAEFQRISQKVLLPFIKKKMNGGREKMYALFFSICVFKHMPRKAQLFV